MNFIRKKFTKIYKFFFYFGLDLKKLLSIRFIYYYLKTLIQFKSQGGTINSYLPILFDIDQNAGSIKDHYFLQDLHCARLIYNRNPYNHIDIGSRIDGFITHLATFRKVEVLDIRDLNDQVDKNIIFKKVDIIDLPRSLLSKYQSVSCLHTIEHVGLGRYGDRIDVNGHLKALENILKIVKVGGIFYLSVPISERNLVFFNMHRVFHPEYIISLEIIKKQFKLLNFDYIDDKGILHTNINPKNIYQYPEYGCGIYQFKKFK